MITISKFNFTPENWMNEPKSWFLAHNLGKSNSDAINQNFYLLNQNL